MSKKIKLNADDQMVTIDIRPQKQYKSRVLLECMFDVNTIGKTEEQAGAASEEMVNDIAKYLRTQLETADGLPSPSECWLTSWGVRNMDIEEIEDEEEDE